jgi:hypothetical protein
MKWIIGDLVFFQWLNIMRTAKGNRPEEFICFAPNWKQPQLYAGGFSGKNNAGAAFLF